MSLHPAEQDRADVAAARRIFIRRQPTLDPDHLIFIDEICAVTNMALRDGRADRRLRLLAPVPHGHWKPTTLVAGLRASRITAPWVFDGAINSEHFHAISSKCWRRPCGSRDIVMLDNLTDHKAARVAAGGLRPKALSSFICRPTAQTSIRSSGPLPNLKAALRKAAGRTREGLRQLIGQTLTAFQPQECCNFFKNRRLCNDRKPSNSDSPSSAGSRNSRRAQDYGNQIGMGLATSGS